MDSLALAITALALPLRHESRSSEARHASVIGMAGTAAEQALVAVLVQVHGDEAAFVNGSQYKTASQVLSEVKELLRRPVSRASFLTAGLVDGDAHRAELLDSARWFATLLSFRAAGLHGGRGVGLDVAVAMVARVHSFMCLLAKSNRIKPYLATLPALPSRAQQTEVLLQDLIAKLHASQSTPDQAQYLRAIFLVLPETPPEQPGWLSALERVSVVPTAGDIALLMATVQDAIPARLRRLAGGGHAMPVAIRPQVPAAVPVAAVHLRREFNSLSDQFAHDSASANGRLVDGTLHLPPADFLIEMFQIPLPNLVEQLGYESLTGQQAWPFIAAALADPRATPRPYWFLVRLVPQEQLQHLIGYLNRAAAIAGRASFTDKLAEALTGIGHIRMGTAPAPNSPWSEEVVQALLSAQQARTDLVAAVTRNIGGPRDLHESLRAWVISYANGTSEASETRQILHDYAGLIPEQHRTAALNYWTRLLAEASYQPNDRAFLTQIARDRAAAGAATSARKALRAIDAHMHGPTLAIDL